MLSRQARQIRAYLETSQGRNILRTAKRVLNANNIRVSDDVRGHKSLILAYALYPDQLESGMSTANTRTADFSNKVDFCDADGSLCQGKKQIPRSQMPVLEGAKLLLVIKNLQAGNINWKMPPKNPFTERYVYAMKGPFKGKLLPMSSLSADDLFEADIDETSTGYRYHEKSTIVPMKVAVKRVQVPATGLRPTQKEINMDKAFGMARAYLLGKFPGLTKFDPNTASIISKEGFIVDGHHRWAAISLLNTYSPEKLIGVVTDDGRTDLTNTFTDIWNVGATGEVSQWLKKNKGGGDPSLTLGCFAVNLPMKDLLPCLNACTDSLGVMRKPFDEKDGFAKSMISIPQSGAYSLNKHQEEFVNTKPRARNTLKNILNQTDVMQEDDDVFQGLPNQPTSIKLARLHQRLRRLS